MFLFTVMLLFTGTAAVPAALGVALDTSLDVDHISLDVSHTSAAQQEASTCNANCCGMMARMPMDSCIPGLPQNIALVSSIGEQAAATTDAEASSMLGTWLEHAKSKAGTCINSTGTWTTIPEEPLAPGFGGLVGSKKYDMAFMTIAKVASNTVNAWLKCRFAMDYTQKEAIESDFLRTTIVRDPASRAISGFLQIVSHLILHLRLPPEKLDACIAAWPDSVHFLSEDPKMSKASWPQFCKDAWLFSPFDNATQRPTPDFTGYKTQVAATRRTGLLAAIWKLPCSCRAAQTNAARPPVQWFCPPEDTGEECVLSDEQVAAMYGHALSTAAHSYTLGCDDLTFGGEHMMPYSNRLKAAMRIDLAMKLESVSADEERFEAYLKANGTALPPTPPGCTFEEMHGNEGNDGIPDVMYNTAQVKAVVARSTDLQRRVCALYYQDFVCGGYSVPDACAEPTTWMSDTIDNLMSDAPVVLDGKLVSDPF